MTYSLTLQIQISGTKLKNPSRSTEIFFDDLYALETVSSIRSAVLEQYFRLLTHLIVEQRESSRTPPPVE